MAVTLPGQTYDVGDPSGGLLGSEMISLRRRSWEKRRCTLSERDCAGPAHIYATEIARDSGIEASVEAICTFIEALSRIPGVEAVAFLNEDYTPVLLDVQLFARLETGRESASQIVGEVTAAHAALYRGLYRLARTSLRFASTDRMDLAAVERQLLDRWVTDPTRHLLRLIDFR